MRFLILDHHFEQDIERLGGAIEARGDEFRVMPYSVLRDEALAVLPREVATGLEPFARPDWEAHRRRFARRLERIMEEEHAAWPFDAFVAPSDSFFYLRAAPEACQRLGLPFLVAQKETAISPHTMQVHSRRVSRHAPPIAEYMTVCSERHREFWLRAGADPSRVVVTGQPRFDYYAESARWPDEVPYGSDGPVALFLSYFLDAYHPDAETGTAVWSDLHRETEEGLWELASRGWRILVKPHPQQDFRAEQKRLSGEVGSLVGTRVFLIGNSVDTRTLIAGSDAVIGFQSTALIEAMAAGRPAIYTGWSAESQRIAEALLPFSSWTSGLACVTRAGDLPDAVEAELLRAPTEAERDDTRAIIEEQIGPIDGRASDRAVRELTGAVDRYRARGRRTRMTRGRGTARRQALRVSRLLRRTSRPIRRVARETTTRLPG